MPGDPNAVWTSTSLWSMRFTGSPTQVYEFTEVGTTCGLIGPNAAAQVGGTWFWMAPDKSFWAWGGGQAVQLPCTLSRDVADNLAFVQGDKVFAFANVGKNYAEVWWLYPDIRDGNECSRYVMVDTKNPAVWSCGTWDRTAWAAQNLFEYPLAVDTSGRIWFQEKGFTEDGAPRSWALDGAFQSDPPGQLIVDGIRPDTDDLQGGYGVTFHSRVRNVRGIVARTYPTRNVTGSTGQRSVRVQGEQVRIAFAGTDAPTFWRLGAFEIDLGASKARR
jgi:hypothetical protein